MGIRAQPQTVMFSAETLLFDKHCWSFQRQHQFQADTEWSSNGQSWGPPMPCTTFLVHNDREAPRQRAVLSKEYPMRTVSRHHTSGCTQKWVLCFTFLRWDRGLVWGAVSHWRHFYRGNLEVSFCKEKGLANAALVTLETYGVIRRWPQNS